MSNDEDRSEPGAGPIPVLQPAADSPLEGVPGPELAGLRRLPVERRRALSAEAHYLLDELLDECLPFLEARLRERLEQRVRELLAE